MYLLLLVVLVPLLIIYCQRTKQKNEEFWKYIMAMPGPKSIPILGTNYTFLTPESQWIQERKRSMEYYPIYKLWTIGNAIVNLILPEDIELVLANSKHNTKSFGYTFLQNWLGTGLLTSEGSKWHKRRKVLTPAFHFSILQEFTRIINNETDCLVQELKKLCHKPYVDVVQPVTEFALFAIGETSLGLSLRESLNCGEYKKAVYDYGENFIYRLARPWLYNPFIYNLTATAKKSVEIVNVLHRFSLKVIYEKMKEFGQGENMSGRKKLALLDLLVKYKLDGADIDDKGIREELDTFIFAGHDTVSLCLSYTLMVLANNPAAQEEMYNEIISIIGPTEAASYANLMELKYMERCIKESLRLYPSVPTFSRIVGEDIKLSSGYTLPKGSYVRIQVFDLHRRPEIWENPEKFDPDRFLPENISKRHPFSYVPFSAGGRNCIGQKYAMLELKTALCGILRNFKLEPYDRPEHMIFKSDLVLRPEGKIRVKFVPRN